MSWYTQCIFPGPHILTVFFCCSKMFYSVLKQKAADLPLVDPENFQDLNNHSIWIYVPCKSEEKKLITNLKVLRLYRAVHGDIKNLDNKRNRFILINSEGHFLTTAFGVDDLKTSLQTMSLIYDFDNTWRLLVNEEVVYYHPNELQYWPHFTLDHTLQKNCTTTDHKIEQILGYKLDASSDPSPVKLNVHALNVYCNQLIPVTFTKHHKNAIYIKVDLPMTRCNSTYSNMTLALDKQADGNWYGCVEGISGDGNSVLLSAKAGPILIRLADEFCRLLSVKTCTLIDVSTVTFFEDTKDGREESFRINLKLWKSIKSGLSWYNQFGFWQKDITKLKQFTEYISSVKSYYEYKETMHTVREYGDLVLRELCTKSDRTIGEMLVYLSKKMDYKIYVTITSLIFENEEDNDDLDTTWQNIMDVCVKWLKILTAYEQKHVAPYTLKKFLIWLFDMELPYYQDFINNVPLLGKLKQNIRNFTENSCLIKYYDKGCIRANRQKRKILNIDDISSKKYKTVDS